MLINERVTDMFNLFSMIMPIKGTKAQEKAIQKTFGMTLKEFTFVILHDIGKNCIAPENKERAEGIFDWMSEAILYMKGERDDLPEMEIDYSEQEKEQSSLK